MKAIQFFAIAALGAALFASCSSEDELAQSNYPMDNVVRIMTSVDGMNTKHSHPHFFYGFPNLRIIKQVGRNLLRIGIDFREETEPQYHHALVGDGMWSELREFYEGEMQALDDLIAVLIMHDAVVVDEKIYRPLCIVTYRLF